MVHYVRLSCVLVILFSAVCCSPTVSAEDSTTISVTTPWARIIGKQEEVLGRRLGVFLGLPYAEPPIGELRFRRTVPLKGKYTEAVFNATEFQASCPQLPTSRFSFEVESEDCLYLNIWSPMSTGPHGKLSFINEVARKRRLTLKPVLFYIYGSGYDMGSAIEERHHGHFLASLSDTVLVSLNHRLNVFGFAFGGTESMPGSMGIYDLLEALKWVNKNIKHFGGDPKRVTIYGACSGAMVASAFAISPMVDPKLFHKMFLASSVISPGVAAMSTEYLLKTTRAIAKQVGCIEIEGDEGKTLTEPQIECMRNVDSELLLNATSSDQMASFLPFENASILPPAYGTDVLPLRPDILVVKKLPRRLVHTLIGNEQADDETFATVWPETKQEAQQLVTSLIKRNTANASDEDIQKLFDWYFEEVDEDDKLAMKKAITNVGGDFLHHCPMLLFAETWTRNGQTRICSVGNLSS